MVKKFIAANRWMLRWIAILFAVVIFGLISFLKKNDGLHIQKWQFVLVFLLFLGIGAVLLLLIYESWVVRRSKDTVGALKAAAFFVIAVAYVLALSNLLIRFVF